MPGSVMRSEHAISVIIPTIGRWDSLAKVLADLTIVRASGIAVEVVVVGDGLGADDVRRGIRTGIGDSDSVRCVGLIPRKGVAVARNAGIAEAQTSTLVFLDDDIRLESGWAEALRAILDNGWECATGPVTTRDDSILSRAREDRYLRRYEGLIQGDQVDFFAGGNSVISADLLRAVGGFPEVAVGSDTAVLARLNVLGVVCRFCPGLRILHTHDRGWLTALDAAWRSGARAQASAVQNEVSSLVRSLPRTGRTGLVNAVLLLSKLGGFLFASRKETR